MHKLKLHSTLCALALGLLTLSSCGKTHEHELALPSDAQQVVVIHLDKLISKSGLDQKDRREQFARLSERGILPKWNTQLLRKALSKPEELGIDFEAPIYFYSSPRLAFAWLVKVDDRSELKELLDQLCPSAKYTRSEGKDYTLLRPKALRDSNILIAYNKHTLLLAQARRAAQSQEIIESTMHPKAEQSLKQHASYQELAKLNGDIQGLIQLEDLSRRQVGSSQGMQDMNMIYGISFDPGAVKATIRYTSDKAEKRKEWKERMAAVYSKPITGVLDKYVPTENILRIGMHLDLAQIIKQGRQHDAALTELLPEDIEQNFGSFIQGEVLLAASALDTQSGFVFYAEGKKPETIDSLAANIARNEGVRVQPLGAQRYEVHYRGGTYLIGHQAGINYLIPRAQADQLFKPQATKPQAYQGLIKGSNGYAYVDIAQVLRMPFATSVLQLFIPNKTIEQLQKLQYLLIYGGGEEAQAVLKIDSQENALKVLSDLLLSLNNNEDDDTSTPRGTRRPQAL